MHEFFNAPWLLIPLLPFVVLPFKMGLAFMNAVSAATLTILSMRRGKDGRMIPLLFLGGRFIKAGQLLEKTF